MNRITIKYLLVFCITLSMPAYSASNDLDIIDVNISKLEYGKVIVVQWNEMPINIYRRSKEQVATLKKWNTKQLGDPKGVELIKSVSHMSATYGNDIPSHIFAMQKELEGTHTRSINEEYFISIALSPYDGCMPTLRPEISPSDLGKDWKGGFFNPCSGEKYDLAGRILIGHNHGNNWNLRIPPYKFISKDLIRIGEISDNLDVKAYDLSPNFYSKFYYIEQRLLLASLWGDEKAIINILDKGVDPNKVNIENNYPLHMAVLGKKPNAIKILLKYGAKPDVTNSNGKTPIDFSKTLKLDEITTLLKQHLK